MPADTPASSPLLAALGLDLESSLAAEPRFLSDGVFLGAQHGKRDDGHGEGEEE